MITHALILTAGLGTRLHPLTMVRAKPAMPVAGVPLVRRIVHTLASHGVTDIVCNLHHRPETIAAALGDGSDLGVRVRYSWEQPTILGAAGGPRQALSIVGAETFLIANGDTLTDFDMSAFADDHRRSGARVTLALVPALEPARYGGVRMDADGKVTGFERAGQSDRPWHFIGMQIVNADVFAALSSGEPARSIGGLYDRLIETAPGAVRGFVTTASFWDVGTVADYWKTSWGFVEAGTGGADVHGQRARVHPTARVSHSLLWDDVVIGQDAALDECIVTDGVTVPEGATYRRTILIAGSNRRATAMPLTL